MRELKIFLQYYPQVLLYLDVGYRDILEQKMLSPNRRSSLRALLASEHVLTHVLRGSSIFWIRVNLEYLL